MRLIFLLFILFAVAGCDMQNGANKDYIISQMNEKDSNEINSSK